jgi:hypothetical protein
MGRSRNGATRTSTVLVAAYGIRGTLRACSQPLTRAPWVGIAVTGSASPHESAGVIVDLPTGVATRAPVRLHRPARDPAHLNAARTAVGDMV